MVAVKIKMKNLKIKMETLKKTLKMITLKANTTMWAGTRDPHENGIELTGSDGQVRGGFDGRGHGRGGAHAIDDRPPIIPFPGEDISWLDAGPREVVEEQLEEE